MVVSLHNLASTYHLLPSEALERASTFDMYVLNIHTQWQNHQREVAEAQSNGHATPPKKKYSTEELQNMVNAVRQQGASK